VSPTSRKTVVIAGATGTVGRALGRSLPDRFDLVGLTRDPALAAAETDSRWEWRLCDLYSRADTFRALDGADYAIYLAHTARPSARLTQASSDDLDLLCADNFARAADHHDLEHIVQLQSLLHEFDFVDADRRDSVTQTLESTGVPTTSFVTDIVVGPGGTASRALERLVRRLPVMLCPAWTTIPLRVVDADDVAEALGGAIGEAELFGTARQLAGPEQPTYLELMRQTAHRLDKKRWFIRAPVIAVGLSALWVSVFAGLPYRMMRHFVRQVCLRSEAREPEPQLLRLSTDLQGTLERSIARPRRDEESGESLPIPRDEKTEVAKRGTQAVRSVQRLRLPPDRDAAWAAAEYTRWLPKAMAPFLHVEVDETQSASFYLRPLPWPLLVLSYAPEVSRPDRQLYWISGGMLAAEQDRGRLEFREILDGRYVLAAIHEFHPALPWLIYRFTQALVHLWVMRRFGRHLQDIAGGPDTSHRSDLLTTNQPSRDSEHPEQP
jgi:uncharacterized protein YbjT (DUF2867 family)